MLQGMERMLQSIRQKPDNIKLQERFLLLVAELPEEERKADLVLKLAAAILVNRPQEAMRLSYMVYEYDRSSIAAVELLGRCFRVMGKSAKADVLEKEVVRLQVQQSQNSFDDKTAAKGKLPRDLSSPRLVPPQAVFSLSETSNLELQAPPRHPQPEGLRHPQPEGPRHPQTKRPRHPQPERPRHPQPESSRHPQTERPRHPQREAREDLFAPPPSDASQPEGPRHPQPEGPRHPQREAREDLFAPSPSDEPRREALKDLSATPWKIEPADHFLEVALEPQTYLNDDSSSAQKLESVSGGIEQVFASLDGTIAGDLALSPKEQTLSASPETYHHISQAEGVPFEVEHPDLPEPGLEDWLAGLDRLLAEGRARRALVEIRAQLELMTPELRWAIAVAARLPQIWQTLGLVGFTWSPSEGAEALREKLAARSPQRLSSLVAFRR